MVKNIFLTQLLFFSFLGYSSAASDSCFAPNTKLYTPIVTIQNDSICPGLQGTLDAGLHTSYIWSTGATTQTISASAGTYTVTVSDLSGATASATAQIVEYIAPELTYLQVADNSGTANDSVVCHGEQLSFGTNLTFGTGTDPMTLSWSAMPLANVAFTSATDELFANATFANTTNSPMLVFMEINVVDANGCRDSLALPITITPQLGIDTIERYEMSGTPFDGGICFGDSALFVVVPDSSGTYTYSWSTGSTNDSIWVIPPPTNMNTVYFVTITDTYGCTAQSFQSAKGIPAMSGTAIFVPACSSSELDTLSFSTMGGVPTSSGYQYTVSTLGLPEFHNVDWKLPINVPVGNDVTVNVKDEKGCAVDTIVTIPAHTDLTATLGSMVCMDNGTNADDSDDYFTASISASNPAGGSTGKYLLIYNSTILNSGGTDYGTSTVIGTGQEFDADGSAVYTIIVQDFDNMGCTETLNIGPVAECSDCPTSICLPIQIMKE